VASACAVSGELLRSVNGKLIKYMVKVDDKSAENTVANAVRAIQEARHHKGMSMYRLAKLTGLHPSTIGLVERGQRSPSLFVLVKLAKALELSLGGVFTECEECPSSCEARNSPLLENPTQIRRC
jgi:ribosome-binding protein aMBF1 (putative translation factor)